MDIQKELSSNQTVLLLMPGSEYNELMVETVKELSNKSVCYVTTNKTYDSLSEIFKKKGIDMKNMVFIDAISKTLKKTPDQGDNVYYVSSPGALTELSLAISKFLRHDFDYLVFDSITNLAIYQKAQICAKFLSSLINNIKKNKTRAVFYALEESSAELVKHASLFVDKVAEVNKSGKVNEVVAEKEGEKEGDGDNTKEVNDKKKDIKKVSKK